MNSLNVIGSMVVVYKVAVGDARRMQLTPNFYLFLGAPNFFCPYIMHMHTIKLEGKYLIKIRANWPNFSGSKIIRP